jgi:hypothetical protein
MFGGGVQGRENMRNPAKTAAILHAGLSSAFPEFPTVLPSIPQRYSRHFFGEPEAGARREI